MGLVTIGWFTEPWNAHIAHGRLNAEDIFSCVVHEHHISANWMYSNVLGNVKVQVLEQDRDKAELVLKRLSDGEYAANLIPFFERLDNFACPVCNASVVTRHVSYTNTLLAFTFFFLAGIAYPPPQNIRTCSTCSYKWKV